MADDFYALLAQIKQEHPDIFGILSKPGVFAVVNQMIQAEENQQPWTTAQIQAALEATPYYQQTDSQQRAWDQLQATDPATATTKVAATKQLIDNLQVQLGVKLDTSGGLSSPGFAFLNNAVKLGWTPDQIKYNLLASVNKTVTGGGDLGQSAADIKKQFDDYGVPVSDNSVMDWATKLQSGAVDANAITGYAQEQAKSLFPGLSDAISRGITVRTYATPYLQIAQQELGIDPETQSLTDPKWMAALNRIDPKTGQRVSMNLQDWTSLVRTDPTYGYDKTNQALTQGASLSDQIAQMMGGK